MGMIAKFVVLQDTKLNELKANPMTVAKFFSEQVRANSADAVLDIDKSWQGIHFLLTGEPFGGKEPNSLAILGGVEIGEDLGYGPARYLDSAKVRLAAAALADISTADLRKRYIPADLEAAAIYPTGIWKKEAEGAFEYLVPWYKSLQAFYGQAAKRGDAMLLAVL